MKLLIAEDTRDMNRALTAVLESQGYEVTSVFDGIEALDHIHKESYDGIISGFNTQSIFVELPNTIEGVIPLGSLSDDFYDYHEESFQMIGSRTRKVFNLGDPVRIQVVSTDKAERRIVFRFDESTDSIEKNV